MVLEEKNILLSLENNQLRGGNNNCTTLHHPVSE